ncbi:hypothetical protein PL321_14020 [Caloramator sp. mosi_1]|uniref:hypothetical protein n=1 Tax=Caloramator sp. mosi_1 TaxID=3023090 RepID=UPI00235F42C6|nr:hypothetical protein [Caloramator sp. mosi_1]WDC83686.1 hypothetical protein PL321_14020 [Caloramator sp. mosi_1]
MIVTTEEPTSDKLLKASAVIAILPLIVPTINLNIKRSILMKIPTPPDRYPTYFLSVLFLNTLQLAFVS